jgi:hypothetical protein
MKSQFQQYEHHPDCTITLEGLPHVKIDTIQDQGHATARDLERELGMPTYFEEWEALATPLGLSPRMVRFVLMDESETRLQGNPRLQPRLITLPPTATCPLEFGHRGFVVGMVSAFFLGFKENIEDLRRMQIDIPAHVEGECILAQAQLFDSPLADKAWEALQRGLFTHVCPLILRQNHEPPGTGQLVEVSLTTGDYPGCPGAKILKMWEA